MTSAELPATPERTRSFFGRNSASLEEESPPVVENGRPTRWSMGVLNDLKTHEVPGSVLLLANDHNEPLGLRHTPSRTSASSLPAQLAQSRRNSHQSHHSHPPQAKKKTPDGRIILEPQPEDSGNDPLNWPKWRRDMALLSLGLYCMVGGGMTPILAAGFTNVAATYKVTTPQVALTTGLYMMGLGIGSVVASPTAILWGKRPVYLFSVIVFILSAVWCASSPNYASLVVARIFQGIAVSPVECLPSATVAEIFFLHERAYRLGIYTLLLLGGKNLVPLVSAAIIQSLGWRWVFWIVAMVVGFCGVLLFFFVPESFWDRTPTKSHNPSKKSSRHSLFSHHKEATKTRLPGQVDGALTVERSRATTNTNSLQLPALHHNNILARHLHVGFAPVVPDQSSESGQDSSSKTETAEPTPQTESPFDSAGLSPVGPRILERGRNINPLSVASHDHQDQVEPRGEGPPTPGLHNFNSPWYNDVERSSGDYVSAKGIRSMSLDGAKSHSPLQSKLYTAELRDRPALTFVQTLKPYNGRLHFDKWSKVAIRPFILYAYPAVLWSSVVYACAIGWLIVLSESVAVIYRSPTTYGFSALSTGLIYISPFIGGILGTAVAGKVSDIIVRFMSKRNGGLYEPEFRLVMAAPVAVTTVIGLMGYGWAAGVHDNWIIPTIFFGIISFGCSLGSTTAITFCVDSYRQYAGEALVTLNFTKNIFHGLVFSLFFNDWLQADGSKTVFIWLGVIQLILMVFTIPMYIFGKRARMWTVRKNLMEQF